MIESILTWAGIYFLCWFKFISGPVLGSAAGYSVFETIMVTVAGMMSSVFLFTILGKKIRDTFYSIRPKKKKAVFTKKNRNIVRLWSKYGEIGIALFTPILLTPIGGTLIMVSFGVKKKNIFTHMFWSACLWAIIFSFSIERILAIPFIHNLFV